MLTSFYRSLAKLSLKQEGLTAELKKELKVKILETSTVIKLS
jgi:hypothetical protein